MNKTQIRKMFKAHFNGQSNFITPDVITYGKINGYVYELSRGRGIWGDWIYGVTVLKTVDDTNITEKTEPGLSRMFHSLDEATEYCANL